jgi:LAS superfamily LD-carboxypeptidase LdcB
MEKFFEEITGRTEEHLIWSDELESKINKSALIPLITLKECALSDGLDLKIASGFRGFPRQEEIWNKKMRGETPILDKNHKPLDAKKLNQRDLVFAILKWSAIPGASRHHWGTDFDFFDGNTLGGDYKVQLIA